MKRRRLAANRWASPGGSGEVLVERGDEPLGCRREAEDEAASLAAVQVIADVLAAYDLHGDDVKLDARAVVGRGPSRERGGSSIEVTKRAHDEHNEFIEREMSTLLWSHERKASTYYRNESGRVILPSPFRPEVFWTMCQMPDETKFVIQ